MSLTSYAFFSIIINGSPSRPFSSLRGITQGDPLSPFLFIIMAEGLSRIIKEAIRDGYLKGIPLHGVNPPIRHTQFVDDIMLMGPPMD